MYAPQSSYGGPTGLKTLVDACHRHGLAVVLDVVYNHLGPEGNYLAEFAPFFTASHQTPWGDAVNYDGAESGGVRRFVVDNALYWLTEYHVDALRLDAIHGIYDFSARHILEELADEFHAQAAGLGRSAWLIAESDLNDARVIKPRRLGGYGVDAQWLDDFHHSLHVALTGDTRGYFADYEGLPSLAKSITEGFVLDGKYSGYRRRRHGSLSIEIPGEQFVVFAQNHDQIANALSGRRACNLLSLEQQKVAAALLIFSPFLPLLFMGQEYGEIAGFHYFTDHGDAALAEAVREGRRREAGAFLSDDEFFDPQDAATFARSKINWRLREQVPHAGLLAWYQDCIAIRKQHAALHNCRKDLVSVAYGAAQWVTLVRRDPSGSRALLVCNVSVAAQTVPLPLEDAQWSMRLWSGQARYGPAAPASIATRDHVELPGRSAALYIGL